MVGDNGQVAVSLAVADLVDPDPQQPGQPAGVDLFGDDPFDDARGGLPRGPQQPGDGGLVSVLSKPRHGVLEVTGVPGPGTSPRHVLGADPTAASAVQPADLGFQQQLARPQIQMPPAAHRGVVATRGPPAARAAGTTLAPPQPHHHPFGGELDRGDRSPGNRQHPVECSGDAHVRLASESVAWSLRNLGASTCASWHHRTGHPKPLNHQASGPKPLTRDPRKAEESRK